MEAAYFVPIYMLFFILFFTSRSRREMLVRKLIKKRKTEDKAQMTELAKNFINKECLIYTYNSQISGVLKEVSDGAVLIDKNGTLEAVNIDYVVRIREYPRNKNGKKKTVIFD